MTFQSNVRATFYWRTFAKQASVVALAVTFGTSFAIIGTPEPSLALAYVFLLNMVILVGVVFYMTTKPQVNIYRSEGRWYSIADVWKPILLGLVVIFSAYILILALFGFPLGDNSVQQNFRDVLLFAVFVGFVEEFMRWTWLQTLPWSVITANGLWVLLHPEVAPILNGAPWSPFFATLALSFGLMQTVIMWLYETPMRGGLNRYLGPIFAATLHAGFNSLVIIWKVQVVVPGTGTTVFGPMYAPAVLVAGVFTFTILSARWAMTRRGQRAPRRRAFRARRW